MINVKMNNTGDFSDITRTDSCVKPQLVRNAYSSVKRPKIPLNRLCIEKELEELEYGSYDSDFPHKIPLDRLCIENEIKELENEDNDSDFSQDAESSVDICTERKKSSFQSESDLSTILENRKKELSDNNNSNNIQDSFDLNFEELSLETPVKPKPFVKSLNFNTPASSTNFNIAKPTNKLRTMFEHNFVTPKQSSILVPHTIFSIKANGLKTPITSKKPPAGSQIADLYTNPSKLISSNGALSVQKPLISRSINQNDKENTKEKKPISIQMKTIHELSNNIVVNDKEYIVFKLLGTGGSSKVFQCLDPKKKCIRAIKCVSLHNDSTAEGYINEVKLLHKLHNCDKVITMYDYQILEKEKQLLMVLEAGEADLSQILHGLAVNTTHLSMHMLIYYWMEMIYAVKQIHDNGIVHSDLKPTNFLKVGASLKLIDFGIASCIESGTNSVIKYVQEGTVKYMSPEAIKNDCSTNINSPTFGKPKYKLSYKSDVWSLGCILYQLVYRRTPFEHITDKDKKLATLINPEHKIEYPEVPWCPIKIIYTIKECLQYNMQSRPSIDRLIADYEKMLQNL